MLVLVAWPLAVHGDGLKGGVPRSRIESGKQTVPSGTWKGICADGGPDWGDPMPIEMTFKAEGGQLSVEATIDFESDTKEKRRAKAALKGKAVAARWVLRGTMTDINDKTEWDVELDTKLESNRLSGKFLEKDNNDALMCRFSWTR